MYNVFLREWWAVWNATDFALPVNSYQGKNASTLLQVHLQLDIFNKTRDSDTEKVKV